MKKHNGMRPHDVLILVDIAAKNGNPWMMKDIAMELGISGSEVSESLSRSVYAGLISSDKTRVMRSALMEFLEHGLRYVYPQQPGALVRGVATAHSAPPLVYEIQSTEPLVWPHAEGTLRGQAVEPLHPNVPSVCLNNSKLHELLALVDTMRLGKSREKQLAISELKKRI